MSNPQDTAGFGRFAIVRGHVGGGVAQCGLCAKPAVYDAYMLVHCDSLIDNASGVCPECAASMAPDLAELVEFGNKHVQLCGPTGDRICTLPSPK